MLNLLFVAVLSGFGVCAAGLCVFGLWFFEEERSALYTFPNLRNFRVAVLRDFRRVFAHVAPVFLDRGIANIETKVGHRIPNIRSAMLH